MGVGKNPGSLKSHLKTCNPQVYDMIIREDEENNRRKAEKKMLKALKDSDEKRKRKKGQSKKSQLAILPAIPSMVKYAKDDPRQKLLDNMVAIYVGATNAPYSVVKNEHFKAMLQAFDARYRVPGSTHLLRVIDGVILEMKRGIQSALFNARKINFCADIWSKRGLTSSYLGITAHFYSPIHQCIKHATLAVRYLPYPHTGLLHVYFKMYLLFVQILGDAICDLTYQIIQEWGIPLSKVQFIITDNGSNMIKPFKSVQASRSVKCTVVDEGNVKEQELRVEGSQSMDEEEVEETEGEVTEDEDEGVEASAEEQERLVEILEEEIN